MGCQTKIWSSLLFFFTLSFFYTGCSSKKNLGPDHWATVHTTPVWFAEDAKLRNTDRDGNVEPHLFFDSEPKISFEDHTLFFIVTTPAKSTVAFDYDILSGHRYGKYLYCDQNDSWGKYSGTITTPPYTEGIVPQMLDQLGKPQKILVFGNEKFYQDDFLKASHQVRVVGGVVEQVCHEGTCIGRNTWESRMVLLAVDPHDTSYSDVTNIDELKEKINWEYFKAFLQNAIGRNSAGENDVPAVRVTGEIKPVFAMKFASSFSHVFNFPELRKIRTSCLKLYDYVWQTFGSLKHSEKKVNNLYDLKEKIIEQEKLKISGDFRTFGSEFRNFHAKYGKEFQTCTDFVKTPHLQEDPAKHWFFTLLAGFYKLERLGHVYNCNQRVWQENPFIGNSNKREYDPAQTIVRCTDEDLDLSMGQLVTYMNSLRMSGKEFYRYIEYDDTSFGTHERLHSWVNVETKNLGCKDQNLAKKLTQIEIFPEDVKWINRSNIHEKKLWGIIY
ncbi:MAG: hypothetical protein ACOYL6_17895 [Bacteriovoracaceae bacterium]